MNYSFLRFPDFKLRALTLSYDDGVVFDKKLIAIMKQNGLKGTFNLNSELFAQESGGRKLTLNEALQLYDDTDFEVAVHGAKHVSLAEVPIPWATCDILIDRMNLEKLFHKRVQGMAYPNNSYDDKVVDMLSNCGIVYSRTTHNTESFSIPQDWLRLKPTCHHANPKLLELVDEFLADPTSKNIWRQNPRLFYLWGHSYEFNDNNNWEIIENFAKKIGNNENIWYATNIQIYDYVKAFDSLVFGVNKDYVYNPTALDVYICFYGKNILVHSGEFINL